MLVKVKRFFISSVYGNVDEGRILDISDAKAKQLIAAGLVSVYASSVADVAKQSSFHSPVEADQAGSLSQADQALQNKTVSESEPGEKKVTYRKKRKSLS